MLRINIGYKKLNNNTKNAELFVKKYALMYLSLCSKDYHYYNMEKYIREKFETNTSLYSICYNIIMNVKINRYGNNYSIIIAPDAELLYKIITFGNREVKGISILNNALRTLKR